MRTVIRLMGSKRSMRYGNHSVVVSGECRKYFYYDSCICTVYPNKKQFHTSDCGWDTVSTHRAINAYVRQLQELGYTQV